MQINWIGECLDTFFSLFGKFARWQNNQGRRICFIMWMMCSCYWSIRNIYVGFYSQSFFCLLSVGLHCHGFYKWKQKGIGDRQKLT